MKTYIKKYNMLQSTRLLRISVSCNVDLTDELTRVIESHEQLYDREDTARELEEIRDRLSCLTDDIDRQKRIYFEMSSDKHKENIPEYNNIVNCIMEIEHQICKCTRLLCEVQSKIFHDDDAEDLKTYGAHVDSVSIRTQDFTTQINNQISDILCL